MKLRNLKRFASLVVSLVMVFALAVPGFAASTSIDGGYEDVELSVEVSESGNVIVNPFGLPYTVYEDDDNESVVAGEQITNPNPMTMVNRSAVAMSVVATVIGEIGEGAADLEFATDLNAGTKAKKMVVNYEVFSTSLAENDLGDEPKMYGELAKLNDKTPIASTLVTATASSTTSGDIILEKGTKVEGDYQAVAGGIAMFRLSGKVTKNPVAGKEWNGDDTFNVTVAYTFEPSNPEAVESEFTGTFNVNPVFATAEISIGDLPASASNIKWRSSNMDAVTVEDNGSNADTLSAVITYVGEGDSTITVTFSGNDTQYQASVEVEGTKYVLITGVAASALSVSDDEASVGKITADVSGIVATDDIQTSTVSASAITVAGEQGQVTINSASIDDEGIFTVDLKAVSEGNVTIEIKFKTKSLAGSQEYKAILKLKIVE